MASNNRKTNNLITCVGSANYDYTFNLSDDLVLGTSNPINIKTSLGGVIRNIAENLSYLGNNVSLMSVVGDDVDGKKLLLESSKIMNVYACDQISGESTGGYYAVINKKGHMEIGFANMKINDHMDSFWIKKHHEHLMQSSWIIADMNMKKNALESLVSFSRKENKKLAIIGVSSPKMKNCPDDLKGVDIIIVNRDESNTYFETKANGLEKLSELWLKKGIEKIVVTDSINGFCFGESNNIEKMPAIIVEDDKIIDVTGAGDSFSAALISGLIEGKTFKKSLLQASVAASLTIQVDKTVNPNLSKEYLEKETSKHEL